MHNPFKVGDEEEWDTPQGPTRRRVVCKLTNPMEMKGRHVAAFEDNPQYLVESEKIGAQATHRPEELRPLR